MLPSRKVTKVREFEWNQGLDLQLAPMWSGAPQMTQQPREELEGVSRPSDEKGLDGESLEREDGGKRDGEASRASRHEYVWVRGAEKSVSTRSRHESLFSP